MKRSLKNPIITIEDIAPSRSDLKVDGVFNAAATKYNNEVILLLRVAESFIEAENENLVQIPIMENGNLIKIELDKKADADKYNFDDSRQIFNKATGVIDYLTSLSHIRIARSKDFENFVIDEKPFILPHDRYETWGVEDPRICLIDGVYYINYTAVSELGPLTKLVKTTDFETYEDLGIIFLPENKDVSLINRKIDGKYYAYNRAVPKAFGTPDIWIAESKDLVNWGNHRHVLAVNGEDCWENGRIGGGAPSFETESGWLHIYHAADRDNRYCLGAFLADKNDPGIILQKTLKPLLEPEMDYEINGFFGNVVFTCGLVVEGNVVYIYYGAADDKMCLATFTLEEIFESMDTYNC